MAPRPITPEDLWSLPRVGRPAASPDGAFAVVPVTSYEVAENRGRTRLHRVERDGTTTPLTSPDTDSTDPVVSPDGSRLAFLRTGDGDEDRPQLHVMPLDGGEARRLTDLPLGASSPRWLPDGSALLCLTVLWRGHLTPEATAAALQEKKDAKVKARVTENRVFRYWDHWLTDGEVHHLLRVDAGTGEVTDLTPDWDRPFDLMGVEGAFDVSPDGAEIAFHAIAVGPPYDEVAYRVYTMPAGGGAPAPVWDDGPPMQRRPRYSPDGARLAFGYQVDWPGFYADRTRLAVAPRDGGEPATLTADWDRSASAWEFTPDGERLVVAAEDDARQHLFTIPVAGGDPEVLARGGTLSAPTPAGGMVWCLHESLTEPSEVALAGDGAATRITAFTAEALDGIEMGRVEDVRFTGAEGDEIQMFVVFPPGFDDGRRWPLVHQIHGGPHNAALDAWPYRWNPQVFAAAGRVVAIVNFHGSSSWGNEFAASIHGEWGRLPAADIEAATDHLVAQGFVDPGRMAITGGSYGGYLVSWLLGRTDRYAAAVCHAGVTDLLGQWATDVTHGRHVSFGGHPWDEEGLANTHRWSPTNHSAGWATPTLVVHGEQDYRVVVTQGLELYAILKAKGIEARLVYYPDEGHWILKPQNSLHWYGEFLGWLDRHLAPGPA